MTRGIWVNSSPAVEQTWGTSNPMTAVGDMLVGGTAGVPARLASSTTGYVLTSNGIGVSPTWQVSASGFTNPMTTVGDLIVGGTLGAAGRLAAGTATYVLTSNGAGVAPTWQAAAGGGGAVAGSDKQIQYNNAGAFGAEAGFEYDQSTNTLTVDKVRTAASTTTSSGLRLAHGAAPTSPTDGDVWTTTSGIFARINGATVGPLSAGGSATQGKQTIAMTSGGMRPSLTAGCQPLVALEISSTNPEVVTLNFDPTTEESAQFSIAMPKKWNLGTMTVRFRWSHPTTTTNFGVVWSIAAVSIGDGETMAGAFGTAQQIADTGGATNTLYVTSETPAMTPATTSGGIAAGDTVFFKVSRKVADGSDTMAVDARLHGLDIFITTNADTDA